MRQRGYVEGQNFILEHRFVEGSPGRDSEVVGELVRLNVDVIVAVSQPVVQAAGLCAARSSGQQAPGRRASAASHSFLLLPPLLPREPILSCAPEDAR
jgi:hypothetical protein